MQKKPKTRFQMIKERHKKTFETALKQGKVDEQIQGICAFIAGTKEYYTSSSCSGRIILLEKRSDKKIDTFFHRKWHRTISKEELLEGFDEKTSGELWFRVDPFILHVGCENLENANKILGAMKKAGVKRGGIIVAEEEKFLVELMGTGTITFPIKTGNEKLVSKELLEKILPKANSTLEKNYERLEKLGQEFKKTLG